MGTEWYETSNFEVENTLYDEFLEVVTEGAGYKGIADKLAQKLQVSILIEDEFFHVFARSNINTPVFTSLQKKNGLKYWKPQRVDARINEYVQVLEKTLQPVAMPELPEYGIDSPRLVFPVVIKNKIKKYLNIFRRELSWDQMQIVRAALHSLKVMEICRQAQEELENRIMNNLVLGLISSDKDVDSNYYGEKRLLGFDLSREAVLAVVEIIDRPGQRHLEEVLRSIISDLSMNASATAISDEQAVVLVQSPDGASMAAADMVEYMEELYDALKINFPEAAVKIGVGRQCFKPRDYKTSFGEAIQALKFAGPKPGKREGLNYYHSLKLISFLTQPGNMQSMPLFVQRILGKLYEYEAEYHVDLIESLGCYLDHNCCIQSASRELFIHPNTLRYRLKKAEKIAGIDLEDRNTKLEVQLAITLFRYQGESLWKEEQEDNS